jgi:anti-sigma factor RsiW
MGSAQPASQLVDGEKPRQDQRMSARVLDDNPVTASEVADLLHVDRKTVFERVVLLTWLREGGVALTSALASIGLAPAGLVAVRHWPDRPVVPKAWLGTNPQAGAWYLVKAKISASLKGTSDDR